MRALSACGYLVSGSLHLPSRVLFSFHSRYYCAIGLGSCLGLEGDAPHIRARFPTHATLELPNRPSRVPLRVCHPLWSPVPGDFGLAREDVPESEHHISTPFPERIRFALHPLRSPLLRASRLISLPPRTRMLQFRGFPFLTERSCEQEVPFGDLRITGSMRLPAAFRSLARPSSAPEPSHSPGSF